MQQEPVEGEVEGPAVHSGPARFATRDNAECGSGEGRVAAGPPQPRRLPLRHVGRRDKGKAARNRIIMIYKNGIEEDELIPYLSNFVA